VNRKTVTRVSAATAVRHLYAIGEIMRFKRKARETLYRVDFQPLIAAWQALS
jgi:hypothetical protein